MENQNNEADLVNDLSEVLNELKEIEERSGDCDLWRTYANIKGDFVCFEKCGGATIQEGAEAALKIAKLDAIPTRSAWWPYTQRYFWSVPENDKCQNGWLKDKSLLSRKFDASCDPSVGCMWD